MSFSLCLSFCHSYLHAYEMHNCVCVKPLNFPNKLEALAHGTYCLKVCVLHACHCLSTIQKTAENTFFVQLLMFSDFDFLVIMFLVIAVIQLCSYFNRSTRNLHFS